MTFVRRKIDLTFQLQDDVNGEPVASSVKSFQGTDANTLKVTGLRISASIQKMGLDSMGGAQLRVYGLTLDVMNQLSVLGRVIPKASLNAIQIEAGDDDAGMAVVFQGVIRDAYADLNNAPESAFIMTCFSGLREALLPTEPTSIRGSADVATIMSGLATKAGLLFENTGVTAKLADPYLSGSVRDQISACAQAANINWTIDNSTLAIWPAGASRGDSTIKLSKDTGLIGYPMYTNTGVSVRNIFNPNINYGVKVDLDTDIIPAKGIWTVYGVGMELESETIGGAWHTEWHGSVFGHDVPLG